MVLVADSLTGSETYWYQSNIYYNRDAQNYPAGMADFCEGGKYGQGGFKWVYDDVAIASSYSMGRTLYACPTHCRCKIQYCSPRFASCCN